VALSSEVCDATCGACGSPYILRSPSAVRTTPFRRRFEFRLQQLIFQLRRLLGRLFRRLQRRQFGEQSLVVEFWKLWRLELGEFLQGKLGRLALELRRFPFFTLWNGITLRFGELGSKIEYQNCGF
jgi:hypothetical protein